MSRTRHIAVLTALILAASAAPAVAADPVPAPIPIPVALQAQTASAATPRVCKPAAPGRRTSRWRPSGRICAP